MGQAINTVNPGIMILLFNWNAWHNVFSENSIKSKTGSEAKNDITWSKDFYYFVFISLNETSHFSFNISSCRHYLMAFKYFFDRAKSII